VKFPNKTNKVIALMKPLLPLSIRVALRKIHQKIVFKRAIEKFRTHYHEIDKFSKLIDDLIYGWGNMGWSSFQDYSKDIITTAISNQGPVLECGSGLSTVLLGIIAEDKGFKIYSLEHHEQWRAHIEKTLHKYDLKHVVVCDTPLKDYGTFEWYDVATTSIPTDISLVICDGPPHYTKGGRYGLLPVLSKHLADGAIILLDDYSREHEKQIVKDWKIDFELEVAVRGMNDLYAYIIYHPLK